MDAPRRALLLAAVTPVALLALAGCGDDTPAARGSTSTAVATTDLAGTPTSPSPTSPSPATTDRGWLEGEPEWNATSDEEGATAAGPAGAGRGDSMSTEAAGADATAPIEHSEPVSPGEGAPGPLRAGSVDDNADFAGYLDYLGRVAEIGVPLRSFDPAGRIVVSVVGSDGLPLAGAQVTVTPADGSAPVPLRTTADGTARFHPALYGITATDQPFILTAAGSSATVSPGQTVELVVEQPGGRPAPIAVDVLFLLDATGSMSDEIDRLKTSIDSVADRVSALEGAPDVRFGMTLYRDEGDAFVTATRDFTGDVQAFRADLADVVADGGGDYPEALEEGLAEALEAPAWRDPATTLQLVFLVADAPPQVGRQLDQTYDESLRQAIERGVKIFPVASSESDDQAEAVFRQLAQGTGARFVFLSYGAGGAATGDGTDIASTDYEELALDDLVVRLVAEEIAALTGDITVVPPATAPPVPATNPPGQ